MGKWLAREFDWTLGIYTGRYYNIAQAGIQARFVDSHFGNDTTNTGTPTAPYRTLSRAITDLNATGANGSRIFMNGIFSENLPTQTFWYEYIGCGGGWNGRTVWAFDANENTLINPTNGSKGHNIQTLNYQLHEFFMGWSGTVLKSYVNCLVSNARVGCNWMLLRCYNNILINCRTLITGSVLHIYNSIVFNYFNDGLGSQHLIGYNTYIHLNPLSPAVGIGGVGNIIGGEPQFTNPANNDFTVRITSPLLGAGTLDEITGIRANVGGVQVGLPYNGLTSEFTATGGAIISNLTLDNLGRYTLTPSARTGTLESANIDLGGIYPIERIDVFNIFDHFQGQITQGIFQPFTSPRMTLTIRVKYGNNAAEITDCPWLLMEYGKRPTFSGTGAGRLGNAAPTFDELNEQSITTRFLRLFFTLQNNS